MSVFHTLYDRFQAWLDHRDERRDAEWAAQRNAAIDYDIRLATGQWPTRAEVSDAVDRATTIGTVGSTLTEPGKKRVADEFLRLLDPNPDARAAVEAAEERAWDAHGEIPPGITFAEYTERMGRLAGPHERDDRWLRFGRGGVR